MKPARLLFYLLGLVLVLALAAGGLALTPGVQRWAVLRSMRGHPELKLELDRIAAGFSHVRLEGVRAEKSGLKITLGTLDADYSLAALLFGGRLQLDKLTATGLLVDASRISRGRAEAAAAGAPAATPGVLSKIKLPLELVLNECLIEGRALLPGAAGAAPVETDYQITGGKFAVGQEGTLRLTAVLKNPVATLRTQVTLRATQTDQRAFSRVGLTALLDAESPTMTKQNQLRIAADLAREITGENYTISVDTMLQGTPENLLAVQASLPAGKQEYTGQWKVLTRTAQLLPFFLGATLPEFEAKGEGRFTFNPVTLAASLQGGLQAEVDHLETIDPAWRAIGSVKLASRFDLAETDGIARLNLLEVSLAGENPVLQLTAAKAAEINFKERRLQVGGTAPGEALTLTLHGLPIAWIRPFVQVVDISGGQLTGQLAITGEVDRLRLRAVQPLRLDQLTIVQAGELLLNKAALSAGIEAVLTDKELQAVVTEFSLRTPAGDSLVAQAKVTVPVSPAPSITLVASYSADLPTLLAPWISLGRIKAGGEVDLTLAGSSIDLRRLSAKVSDARGVDLFTASALRPFVYDLVSHRANSPGVTGAIELARINLGRIPLNALPLTLPGTKLGGAITKGDFVLTADGERLFFKASGPLRMEDVSLVERGQPALSGLVIEMQPALETSGQPGFKLLSGDLSIRSGKGATLLTGKGDATASRDAGLQGSFTFQIEVPALATQPIFAGAQSVSAGRASGEIRVALGQNNQVEARATVNGLVAAGSGEILPVANLSFRAVAQADGRISVQVPLLLDRSGQRSDLNFALGLVPVGRGFTVDGKISSEHIELQDALGVLGVFLAPMASASAPAQPADKTIASASLTPDQAAVWSRFQGAVQMDIKSVVRGAEWSMTGLTGLVKIDPVRLGLDKLEAAFGEKGQLAAKGEVKFTGGAQPYVLAGEFSLTEFNAGQLFKALQPNRPATVEGIFTVAGKINGRGETLDRTAELSHGSFELTSRAGVFRGLQRTTSKVSTTTKVVELGASVLGSLFGSEKATKTAEKVAGTAYFVDQLAQTVGELNYDQLSVRLSRDESLNVALQDFSLVAPEIRLIGQGNVTYVAGKPLLEQPLTASLSIAGRGKTEELLGRLKLLNGARDELGYAKTRETVTVGGTLLRPDPTAFFTRLATSKLSEMFSPGN